MKNKYLGLYVGISVFWVYCGIDTHLRLNKLQKEMKDYYLKK